MARDKVKRAFVWLRKALRITDKTTLPGHVLGEIRPSLDVFGWERLEGPGTVETAQGALATDVVVLTAVPDGVARFVIYASCSHSDTVNGLILSMQVRTVVGTDIGVEAWEYVNPCTAQPVLFPLKRNILLQPGEQLICRSRVPPAAGTRLFIEYKFVDLTPGEYLPAL